MLILPENSLLRYLRSCHLLINLWILLKIFLLLISSSYTYSLLDALALLLCHGARLLILQFYFVC
jgi:hypothetical protein